jgi:UV DNA damage repair endonuclease
MKLEKQTFSTNQKCNLCEQKMNPTVNIYKEHHHLCKACYQRMQNIPEMVAKSVERWLNGNVV